MFLLNHTSYDRGDEDIQFREGASSFSYTGDAKKIVPFQKDVLIWSPVYLAHTLATLTIAYVYLKTISVLSFFWVNLEKLHCALICTCVLIHFLKSVDPELDLRSVLLLGSREYVLRKGHKNWIFVLLFNSLHPTPGNTGIWLLESWIKIRFFVLFWGHISR